MSKKLRAIIEIFIGILLGLVFTYTNQFAGESINGIVWLSILFHAIFFIIDGINRYISEVKYKIYGFPYFGWGISFLIFSLIGSFSFILNINHPFAKGFLGFATEMILLCDLIVSIVFLKKNPPKKNVKKIIAHNASYPQFNHNANALPKTPHVPNEPIQPSPQSNLTFYNTIRDFEILRDCLEIISTTANTETFCMRYNLGIEKALSLRIAYNSGILIPDEAKGLIDTILGAKDTLRTHFLSVGVAKQISSTEALKTNRGKIERFKKILWHLENNKSVFDGINKYTSVCDELKKRINELSALNA